MNRAYFLAAIACTFSSINTHATSPLWLTALAITAAVTFALLFIKSDPA